MTVCWRQTFATFFYDAQPLPLDLGIIPDSTIKLMHVSSEYFRLQIRREVKANLVAR